MEGERNIHTIAMPGASWLFIILVLLLLALSLVIFGKTPDQNNIGANETEEPTPSESRPTRIYTVTYNNNVFSPTNLRIHSGDTVRFKNEGIFSIRIVSDPHPEHNNLAGFDSVGDIPQGSYFSFTFAAKGIFGYHEEHDPNRRTGTIIVR